LLPQAMASSFCGMPPCVPAWSLDPIAQSPLTEWGDERDRTLVLIVVDQLLAGRPEPWHFEERPQASDLRCPTMYAGPAHDPRLQL
jgi:hypothetical protein